MRFRLTYLLLLAPLLQFLASAPSLHAQWTTDLTSVIPDGMEAAHFTSHNTGHFAGKQLIPWNAGRIAKTTNGGTLWTFTADVADANFYDLYFISSSTGWAVGELYGNLLVAKTTDAGNTWIDKDTSIAMIANSVHFPSSSIGYVAGGNKVVKSTDGGATWTPLTIPFTQVKGVYFRSDTEGFALAGTGIFRTTDGGGSWAQVYIDSPSQTPWAMDFADVSMGVATGENIMLYTNDGGLTWNPSTVPAIGTFSKGIDMIDIGTGFAATTSGHILKTVDGGVNWFINGDFTSDLYEFTDIHFGNSLVGYAADHLGFFAKTMNAGGTSTSTQSPLQPKALRVGPNPFLDKLTIAVSCAPSETPSVRLLNVLGQELPLPSIAWEHDGTNMKTLLPLEPKSLEPLVLVVEVGGKVHSHTLIPAN